MIYLLVLEISLIVVAFALKLGAIYFLVKLFNPAITFSKLLKVFLLFEGSSFAFYLLASSFLPDGSLLPILLIPIALGALFVLLTQKFVLLNWRKAVMVFVLLFVVVTPLVSFISQFVGGLIVEIPVVQQGRSKVLPSNISGWFQFSIQEQPLPLQVIGYLQQGVSGDYYLSSIRQYLIAR